MWLPIFLWQSGALAQNNSNPIDISPEILRNSPVLQRWLQQIPDVSAEIQNDPSFRPRLRIGYSQYPANNQAGGWDIAISDLLIGRSGWAVNANYRNQAQFNSYGADVNYYLLPLGGYYNVTPVLGYRHLETPQYNRDGLQVGVKIMLVPARGGGGDVALQQTWVRPGTSEEVGIGSLTAGYAVSNRVRIAAEIQLQNARESQESRVGIGIEWMPW